MRFRQISIWILGGLALCSACAARERKTPVEVGSTRDASSLSRETVRRSGESELAGTSWRLVQIASMDDSVYSPDDRDRYTLELGDDGTMSLRADCNRGTGSWSSDSPSQIRFGPVASTRALCPPGSLHDRYISQFAWVRSYVIEKGHLFLATMADGAIIEFEPIPEAGRPLKEGK